MVILRGKQALKKSRDRCLDQAQALFSEPSSDVSHEKFQMINAGPEIRGDRQRFIKDSSLRSEQHP
jgi:hypothetical protein